MLATPPLPGNGKAAGGGGRLMEKLLGHLTESPRKLEKEAVRGPPLSPLYVLNVTVKGNWPFLSTDCTEGLLTPVNTTAKVDLALTTCQALCQACHMNYRRPMR